MNEEQDSKVFNAIVFFLIGIILLLFTSIVLMIPVLNVFIAHALFGGD